MLAPNGNPSILFENLAGDENLSREEALRIWAKAYTPSFKESFGNWEALHEASIWAQRIDSSFWRDAFIANYERSLFEIAQQANGSASELSGAINTFGQEIIDIALSVYPEAKVGDKYVPNMDEKVDINFEPLSKYVYDPDAGELGIVKTTSEDEYFDITRSKFEEKEQIIRDSGAKTGKYGYYYVLNKEQQRQYEAYKKIHKNAIPGATKQGFELSKNASQTVYLKRIRNKNYIYIDLKHFVKSDGILLPKVYGRVRFPIDLVFHGELEKYVKSFEEEIPFISEQEANIRRMLFKTKGVSAAKAANFYLFNIKDALVNLITNLGGEVSYSELNNMDEDTINHIKSLANIDKKVKELVEEYKKEVENMDEDQLRQQIMDAVGEEYDDKTLQGIWSLINHLPAAFLRLLSFDYINESTAFFTIDKEKNVKDPATTVKSVTGIDYIIIGTSINVALRRMHDDGLITDADVNNMNRKMRGVIDRIVKGSKGKIVTYDYLRSIIKRSDFIDFNNKVVKYKGGLESLHYVFNLYRTQATNDITEYTNRQNKGLVQVVEFLKRLEHKRLNKLFTNVTLGKLESIKDTLKFPIDYTVITAHELGHALDYYLQTTKPEIREKLNQFINYMTNLPEFSEYLEKGLHSRGYPTSNTKEIAADLYAWLIAKGAGYDISNSHIATLDQFMKDNEVKVEQIFKDIFEIRPTKKEKNRPNDIVEYIRSLIDDLKEWVNTLLNTKVFATEENKENQEGAMQRLLEALNRLTLRDEVFDVDTIMNSDTQKFFFRDFITPKEDIAFNRTSPSYKVLSTKNQKTFERLMGMGLITRKRWKNMYFVPKQSLQKTVGSPFNDYRPQYWATDKIKVQQLQAIIEKEQLGWLEVVESKNGNSWIVQIQPNRQQAFQIKLFKNIGNDIFTRIANKLSKRLGIKYKIIDSQEAIQITKDSNIPWSGEGAFAYKDTVYILNDALNLENPIHEFAHFFVRAVHKQSPYLVDKIYKELSANPETKSRYIDFVEEMYSDFDADQRKEEVLVRAMTDKALGMIDEKTGNIITEILKKIWNAIKAIIRDAFSVNLKNLDENTTLDQLTAILLGDGSNQTIDLKDASFFSDLFPLYNRKIADELAKLPSTSVKTSIDSFYTVISEHLNRLSTDFDLNELRDILKNERESTLLKDEKELLKLAKDFSITLEENIPVERAALLSFAEAIEGAETISKRMVDHVIKMRDDPDMSNQDKIAVFRKYSFIAREWKFILDKFKDAMNDSELRGVRNPLSDSVQNTENNYALIDREVVRFYEKDGLIKFFREEIDGNIFYQKSLADLKEEEKNLEKAVKEGNPLAAKKLTKVKELLARYELTDKTIGKYLAGEMGDTNGISMWFESYTSNPDPIVGTFTNWFLKNKKRAEAAAQERLTGFENEISKLYKELGYGSSDFQKIADQLIQKEKILHEFDKDGNPTYREVWKFKNQFGNDKDGVGWQAEYDRLRIESEDALQLIQSPAGGLENYRQKKKKFEEFKLKYMFSEEGEKAIKARMYWYEDTVKTEAKVKRDDLLDQIKKNQFTDLAKDESLEKADENRRLWREFSRLSSLRNADGTMKDGRDLEIANAIREFYEKYGDLYEDVEIKGVFEANLKSAQQEILDEIIASGAAKTEEEASKLPQYKQKLNEWYRENMRVRLTQKFYDDKREPINVINRIKNSINDERTKAQLENLNVWQEIMDTIKGYRDDDGQPIGTDLSDSQLQRIRELQERANEIMASVESQIGITDEEAGEFVRLSDAIKQGIRISEESFQRYQELLNKLPKNTKMSPEDAKALRKAFADLRSLQSKIATPYYVDTVNDWLARMGSNERITQFTASAKLTPAFLARFLRTNTEFRTWWNNNHLIKDRWNSASGEVETIYERTHAWNRTLPNDPLLKTLLETENYAELFKYKSDYVQILKSKEYYYRRLKQEYRNKQGKDTMWVTHDNMGQWLPKPSENSATPEQRKYMQEKGIGFSDGRFDNADYLRLKNSQNDRDKKIFNLLNVYTKFHLESQDRLPDYGRLGLEIPRMAKNNVERWTAEGIEKKAKSVGGWFNMMFSKRQDDYELGTGNYDPKQHVKRHVLTDLMNDQISSIPIKYLSYLDPDEVSMDIGKAISEYAVSAETNKVLHEINPIANALKEVLQKNKPKDLKTSSRKIIDIVSDVANVVVNRSANKKGGYNRLQIINNFLERELEGQINKQQLGPVGEKIVNAIMKMGAWGSLGLNVYAGLKNTISGNIQNTLETVYGQVIEPSSFAKANAEFPSLMSSLVRDYYQIGNKGLYTQLFLLFDPMNNYRGKVGTNFSKTALRDLVDMRFVMSFQKFGEINIQGNAWLAMMVQQKVKFRDPASGEEKLIPYLDAWELQDGILRLKEGVDKNWDKNGKDFLQFTSRLHKVNELNQGAYSEESQPEIYRYTAGKLLLFMRKFYVPAAMNRFSKRRLNMGLGDFREGYWVPMMDAIWETGKATLKGKAPSWGQFKDVYTYGERRAMLRALSEVGLITMMAMMIRALGFDDDDEDKYEKLKDNGFIHNFALYQLMMVKSEVETFIPMYGMGLNETSRLLGTPSIAFVTAKRWLKTGEDLINWALGKDRAFYQRDTGIYSEGDIKFFADLLNIVGWRNFAYLTSDQDLQQGIKMYASMQRRI